MNDINNSSLNRLIPPEIKNDEFYAAIQRLAREENIKTVLEIGSSSGGGSTEAFVTGLRENPNQPTLFCMEVSKPRFEQLQKTYHNYSFVKCYNLSSVSLDQFPSPAEIAEFYHKNKTKLNQYPLELVLDWLRQDTDYIVQYGGGSENGIQSIKDENNIELFDLVLIDGSEFTGKAELEQVYGAKYICLDDILTYKNYSNYQKLSADSNYILLAENHQVRNGYAIFKRLSVFATEKKEQLLVRNILSSGMTVFDVGANIGEYSIVFGELVGSAGKVYAFEPTSTTYKKLQQRIKDSGQSNVVPIRKAVYSQNQQIEFNEFAEEYAVWNSIGKPQMVNPKNFREYVPIVGKEIVEAITLDTYCQANGIDRIDYLKIDVEGAESDVLRGATKLLKKQAIRYIQFEISQKMLEGLNRTAKETFEILEQNGYACYQIKANGEIGEPVFDSNAFYENYIALPALPVHFFTIVLNGEPFIRYHIDVFQKLPFQWHWHIVEGVADLKHDTAWSLQLGGLITEEIHRQGRSNDGTSEYLDELANLYPENVTVYRKPEGQFWDGKLEMVNAPLGNIQEECLLWQVDVDELWTEEQICITRQMFLNQPEKTAAFYWCWYFVGENRVISTRNCYTQNPRQDWLRTWRYQPGYFWAAHEPPILVERTPEGKLQNVAALNPFSHAETENQGLVFQHFAYVTPEQLQFKERYYGYRNALVEWQNLQNQKKFPVLLREYFSWVGDDTMVDTAEACGVVPLARKDITIGNWRFLSPEQVAQMPLQKNQSLSPKILIDAVFFQLYNTGIARVWRSLLQEWSNQEFAKHIVVLDRVGTAPKIPGIRYRTIPAYDYGDTDADKQMLQEICDEEGADVFISTYYTTPVSTPSVFMAYDMIPEVMEADFNHPMWREKHHGIKHASAYISISENTAQDLTKFFPSITPDSITVSHCGVNPEFCPATPEEINRFKTKYGISKPYFLLVGIGSNHKNGILFLKAFSQLPTKQGFEIVATGSGYLLSAEMRQYTSGVVVHLLQLEDVELKAAYSGAVALVYPSIYEGFGLPVLEAIACGCPVITCANASIPEVAGEAAIYVNHQDVDGLANAMCDVQKPSLRNSMIAAGLVQSQKFSWALMAENVSQALINATLLPLDLQAVNLIIFPDWQQPEESLGAELQAVFKTVATHPDKGKMMLLVYKGEVSEEDVNLMLSTVAMNLLMEEDLDVSDGPVISLVGELGQMQWQALLPRLQARIALGCDNEGAISAAKAENLPTYIPNQLP